MWIIFSALLAGLVRGFSGFGTAMVFLPIASQYLTPFEAIASLAIMEFFGTFAVMRKSWSDADKVDLARLVVGMTIVTPFALLLLAKSNRAKGVTIVIPTTNLAKSTLSASLHDFRITAKVPKNSIIASDAIASKGVKYWLAIGRNTIAVPNPENPRTRPASKAENIIHIMPFSGSRLIIKCSATIVEPACPPRR